MAPKAEIFKQEYSGDAVNNCSGYFKNVAGRLNVRVPPVTADALIDFISSNWVKIGAGPENGRLAQGFAIQGYLVVALLKAKDHHPFKWNSRTGKYDIPHPYHHGHLAIVLPTTTTDYPYVICGSTIAEGKSDGSKKVYEKGQHSPWREIDAPNVQYYRTSQTIPDPAN